MKKSILSFVAAAAITGTAGANVQAEEVTVKKGDTLWGYSQQYNTPVDMIKEWNGLSSHIIHPEDKLEVYPEKKYIVSKGDTLWDIAREHHVTVDAIMEWNNLKSDLIFPNEEFTLYPNAKAVEAAAVTPSKTAAPKVLNDKPAEIKPAQPAAEQKQPAEKPAQQVEETKPAAESAKPTVESKPAAETTKPAMESKPAAETKPAAESEVPEQSAESAKEETAQKVLTMEATAYTANCEGCSGITATGINLKENPNQKVISVDPNVIPLGTKVHVEGYGEAIAGDTGGAIKGNKIDIFMPSKEDAINFGRQTVKVTILD
ncbi:LysM peptidoglycan-binding domain-containing protein [Bacillus sp. ISL-47]|uniref:LysM peptidoglycan-binding domain-containing protein n=1 Tax=Bacillus sp. ISL-47 TaxID=2819130 RepID=UPI001BEADCA8|nr:LysM peptidoglycan-binding domain-containing protein [Bacillus sp. ISL-47]MBT2689501.1 LysM peptidoglycan-binding domain-containing protein [Bacillus sp. ISL-47]MBT2708319.1 LysM peptidoglycan-binding domain-containing protein [Pseudomonas sp. ISL-84]